MFRLMALGSSSSSATSSPARSVCGHLINFFAGGPIASGVNGCLVSLVVDNKYRDVLRDASLHPVDQSVQTALILLDDQDDVIVALEHAGVTALGLKSAPASSPVIQTHHRRLRLANARVFSWPRSRCSRRCVCCRSELCRPDRTMTILYPASAALAMRAEKLAVLPLWT